MQTIARAYFALQATAVVGWWVVLATVPGSREIFAIRGAPLAALAAFALGDLAVVAAGSAYVALRSYARWCAPTAWLVSGAMLYAALFTLAAAVMHLVSPFGAMLMIPAAVASLSAATVLSSPAPRDDLPSR